jgi:pimeloyl-ACP methyl ester carboxylesterase
MTINDAPDVGVADVAALYALDDATPLYRGGTGAPLVCLHGFGLTWQTWELVLPELERHHDVLAVTLAGHSGGPPIVGEPDGAMFADAVERAMDEAGFERAHIVGHSVGGFIALQLAARGRALSVVALAPAGGWASEDDAAGEPLDFRAGMHRQAMRSPQLWAATEGMLKAAGLGGAVSALPLLTDAVQGDWRLDTERVTCPVRIMWGTDDETLPWPAAAARFRTSWLPDADYVQLENVGHCPHIESPSTTAQRILEFTLA